MGIFDKLKSLTANGAANLIEKVGSAVDGIITSQEEKQTLTNELAKIVNSHEESMETLRVKEVELELKDVDSARNRELTIAISDKAPLLNKIISPVLAIGTVLLTFTLFYIVLFKQLGTEKDIIIYILGALTAITGQIYSYYFGSSAGSKAKQEQLDKITKK